MFLSCKEKVIIYLVLYSTKTTMINFCGKKIQESVPGVAYHIVNVNHQNRSDTSILNEVAKALHERYSEKMNTDKKMIAKIEKSLKSQSRANKKVLVVALDEIDRMSKNLLKMFEKWTSDSQYNFILIGISNIVGNSNNEDLNNMISVRKLLEQQFFLNESHPITICSFRNISNLFLNHIQKKN